MGIVLLTVAMCVTVALTGIVCTRSGREAGKREGFEIGSREGFNGGWAMAHRRIAQTLNVSPASLHCSLLQLEILRAHRDRESKSAARAASTQATDK